MFEKNMRFAFLLDFYSDVIDSHTADILKAYYEDDLSLAEIAEVAGISRQGVRHIIKKGEDELEFFEEKLSLAKKSLDISEISKKINAIAEDLCSMGNTLSAKELKDIADSLLNK